MFCKEKLTYRQTHSGSEQKNVWSQCIYRLRGDASNIILSYEHICCQTRRRSLSKPRLDSKIRKVEKQRTKHLRGGAVWRQHAGLARCCAMRGTARWRCTCCTRGSWLPSISYTIYIVHTWQNAKVSFQFPWACSSHDALRTDMFFQIALCCFCSHIIQKPHDQELKNRMTTIVMDVPIARQN